MSLNHGDLVAWLYILCLACKKNHEEITTSKEHIEGVGRFKFKNFEDSLKKLIDLNMIAVSERPCTDSERVCTDSARYETRRDETNNKTRLSARRISVEKAEQIYQTYPKKKGKGEGIKKLRLLTEDRLPDLRQAMSRFLQNVKKEKPEDKHIPYFSTWMSSWTDWLDADAGKVVLPKPTLPDATTVEPEKIESTMTPEDLAKAGAKIRDSIKFSSMNGEKNK